MKDFLKKINANQITSINRYDKAINFDYEYRPKKGFLFKSAEGFYYTFTFNPYHVTKEEIEEDTTIYVQDKTVYYYPHLDIKTSDGKKHTKYFNTIPELVDFVGEIEKLGLPLVKIN